MAEREYVHRVVVESVGNNDVGGSIFGYAVDAHPKRSQTHYLKDSVYQEEKLGLAWEVGNQLLDDIYEGH